MKRLLTLSLICLWASGMALSGTQQVRVEELYDTYRAKYLAPLSNEKQIEVLAKLNQLSLNTNNALLSLNQYEIWYRI